MGDFRVLAYNGYTGGVKGVLPHPLEWSLTTSFNELSVLTMHYDRFQTDQSVYLDDAYTEVAVEFYTQSGVWEEVINGRFAIQTIEFDHLEESPTRRYDFLGVGEAIKGVLVYDAYGYPISTEGKVKFMYKTPGDIIRTVWNHGVDRGCLSGYTLYNNAMMATQDASGNAWPTTLTMSFEPDQTLFGILNQLVELGMIDYRWIGKELRIYKQGVITNNLSTGPSPIRLGNSISGIDSAPETIDMSQRASHVVVVGQGGLNSGNIWTYPVTGPLLAEGRREVGARYDNISDSAFAGVISEPLKVRAGNNLKNTTRQFHLTPDSTFYPYKSFQVGQFIDVQISEWGANPDNRQWTWANMQMISISLLVNEHGVQGYVSLGDKIDTLLSKLYTKVQVLLQQISDN